MSWRTVVISKRAKLDLKMNNLVVREDTRTTNIHLGEVYLLIIENTSVSLTACLLCELMKQKIKVIFCDEKRNPISELIPYYGSHDCSAKLKNQISWDSYIKDAVWTEIVTEKIKNQKNLLLNLGYIEGNLLNDYMQQIEFKDVTNREGHAAKVYFNALFGMSFTRSSDNNINSALNYGYSILLSIFNREVVSNGYITQLGLFHDNMFNQFNLSSDLMEPFRPIVDEQIFHMDLECFEHEEKIQIINILNKEIFIDGKKHYLSNAIKIYCKSIFDALNENDISKIRFFRNEL